MSGLSDGPPNIIKMVENIKRELTCGICLSTVQNPWMTNCRHVFCKECFNGLEVKRASKEQKSCPMCKSRILPRKCSDAPHISVIVQQYLQLARAFKRDLQQFTVPKEKQFLESQAVFDPAKVASPVQVFAMPKPILKLQDRKRMIAKRRLPSSLTDCIIKEEVSASVAIGSKGEEKSYEGSFKRPKLDLSTIREDTEEITMLKIVEKCDRGTNTDALPEKALDIMEEVKKIKDSTNLAPLEALFSAMPDVEELLKTNLRELSIWIVKWGGLPVAKRVVPASEENGVEAESVHSARTSRSSSVVPDSDVEVEKHALIEENLDESFDADATFIANLYCPEAVDPIEKAMNGSFCDEIERVINPTGEPAPLEPSFSNQHLQNEEHKVFTQTPVDEGVLLTQPMLKQEVNGQSEQFGEDKPSCLDVEINGLHAKSLLDHITKTIPNSTVDEATFQKTAPKPDGRRFPRPPSSKIRKEIFVGFSGCDSAQKSVLEKEFRFMFDRHLRFTNDILFKANFLICMNDQNGIIPKSSRSLMYIEAVSAGVPVVGSKWVIDSLQRKKLYNPQHYFLQSENIGEKTPFLRSKEGDKLFFGLRFYLHEKYAESEHIPMKQLENIIRMSGGEVVTEPFHSNDESRSYFLFAVGSMQNRIAKSLEDEYKTPVLRADWILDSLKDYKLQYPLTKYRVSLRRCPLTQTRKSPNENEKNIKKGQTDSEVITESDKSDFTSATKKRNSLRRSALPQTST